MIRFVAALTTLASLALIVAAVLLDRLALAVTGALALTIGALTVAVASLSEGRRND